MAPDRGAVDHMLRVVVQHEFALNHTEADLEIRFVNTP
jgi:hypothetical protein